MGKKIYAECCAAICVIFVFCVSFCGCAKRDANYYDLSKTLLVNVRLVESGICIDGNECLAPVDRLNDIRTNAGCVVRAIVSAESSVSMESVAKMHCALLEAGYFRFCYWDGGAVELVYSDPDDIFRHQGSEYEIITIDLASDDKGPYASGKCRIEPYGKARRNVSVTNCRSAGEGSLQMGDSVDTSQLIHLFLICDPDLKYGVFESYVRAAEKQGYRHLFFALK